MRSWKKIVACCAVLVAGFSGVGVTSAQAAAPHHRVLELRDECDKASWDVEFPGLCSRSAGSVSLAKFRSALATGGSGAWWIRQRDITIDAGDTVAATNVGGIIHSFTEVSEYGFGCVPEWNSAITASVNNCTFANFGTFVPEGTTSAPVTLSVGVHKFQCIIHPWMRTVVTVRG